MLKIAEENLKPIRPALTVVCGFEAGPEADQYTVTETYDGTAGYMYMEPQCATYMDLSGKGFRNDGRAAPLEAAHRSIVLKVGDEGAEPAQITIRQDEPLQPGQRVTIIIWKNNTLEKISIDIEDTTNEVIAYIPIDEGRVHIEKIIIGEACWFSNSTLVSCNVALRGVETRIDDPELQISDIEIIGYIPDDSPLDPSEIGDNTPVYYAAGYYGDMSELRKFYLSEKITRQEKKLIIKAEDATRFLDKEYPGRYVGNTGGTGGGINRYVNALHEMLNDAGIEHAYITDKQEAPYAEGEAFMLPNVSKRSLIAQAVNLIRWEMERSKASALLTT